MKPIYLDNHATTPTDPRVLEAMLPYFTEKFGNAGSEHPYGWEAAEAVRIAREAVAALIGAGESEVVFTSGATESTNLALQGLAAAYRQQGDHLVTLRTEHKATLDTCRHLETLGFKVTYMPVDSAGLVDLEALEAAITPRTLAVSVLHGHNEIGTLQPLAAIGKLTKARGVLLHADAAQTFGKLPIDVGALGVDLLSFTGHKAYAPKGIGGLYVRRRAPRVTPAPLFHGGGQERGLRPGTLPVPGIVALGAAARLAGEGMAEEARRVAGLRDRLSARLFAELDGIHLNGHPTERLPGNLNVSFDGLGGRALLGNMPGLAVSGSSACTSGTMQASYVLSACGVPEDRAGATLRFGVGRFTTPDEVERAADIVVRAVKRLRGAASA